MMLFLKEYTDYIIFGLLFLMSIAMLAAVFERLWFFKQVKVEKYKSCYTLESELTNHLTIIYTVGSNAPYVGLLGTVIGILVTFYDIGESGASIEVSQIMIGLALALKATAMGILVAIPATILYNLLARKVETKKLEWLAKFGNHHEKV